MLTLSETPSSGNLMVQLIIIVILIIINAFFAASELAILSANPTKIAILAEKKNKKAILVQKLQENETKFLSTIQVGITLAGFFSRATAASTLSDRLASVINIPYADIISLIAVTLILSYFKYLLTTSKLLSVEQSFIKITSILEKSYFWLIIERIASSKYFSLL